MPKKLVLLAAAVCLTSCATVFTKKNYTLKVVSYEENMTAKINDSTYILPADVTVKRSKEDLKIVLATDSLNKDYTIKAKPTPGFLYGNLFLVTAAPVAYAIDFTNHKRFYYGKEINLARDGSYTITSPSFSTRTKRYFGRQFTTPKGQWAFTASIPYANAFYQQPRNEPSKSGFGFLGIGVGLEYYYKDNVFVKLNASSAIDFALPFPAPLDYFDDYESMSANNFTLTHNHKFNRLSFGYGLNYAINTWWLVNPDWEFPSNSEEPRTKRSHSFGLTANTYFQFSDSWSLGLVYSPTFYNTFPKSGSSYQHVISFDIMYRLPFSF